MRIAEPASSALPTHGNHPRRGFADPPRDPAANVSASAAPMEPRSAEGMPLMVLGVLIGCLPLTLSAVLVCSGRTLDQHWPAFVLALYIATWVGVVIVRGGSHQRKNRSGRRVATGMMWALGITGGLFLCGFVGLVLLNPFAHCGSPC